MVLGRFTHLWCAFVVVFCAQLYAPAHVLVFGGGYCYWDLTTIAERLNFCDSADLHKLSHLFRVAGARHATVIRLGCIMG